MTQNQNPPIARLLSIMEKLRNPVDGCDWDKVQSFDTIAPYTVEEAYEVLDAINRDNLDDLKEELGDLLFQVVFHAQMAAELGAFNFDEVTEVIVEKMIARHPHVFGASREAMSETRWEDLKQEERSNKGAKSALAGVALALPALMRAQKLQKRAARTGFDWPDHAGPKAKLLEEMQELEEASSQSDRVEEAGDLLFAAVNLVRSYGIDAEQALRAANIKFERRFMAMEQRSEKPFDRLTLAQQEELWAEVKKDEKS